MALGALLQPLFGDANTALVAVSVLLEAAAVAGIYALGSTMFSRGAGAAAALLLVVSVTFWSYGTVALAYPALAAFPLWATLFAYQTQVEGRNRLLHTAASYALGTGFRPDLALFMAPLLMAACWRQPWPRVLGAVSLAGGGVVLWLLPVALLSGGPASYLAAFLAYTQTDVIAKYAPGARGLEALWTNVRDTGQYVFFTLYFQVATVATGLPLLIWRRAFAPLALLALGVAPVLAFYVLVHVGDPGYVFSVAPALILAGVAGWAVALDPTRPASGWWERVRPLAVSLAPLLLTLIATGNVLVFFLHQRPLTLPGLRQTDAATGGRLAYIRNQAPGDVLLISYDSYKHFRYYLPDYVHSVWLDTRAANTQVFPVPPGVKWGILTDPSVFALAINLPAEAELLPGGAWLARLPVRPGQLIVYEDGRLGLREP